MTIEPAKLRNGYRHPVVKNPDGTYMNEAQIAADVVAEIRKSPKSVMDWRHLTEKDLTMLHHTVGMSIRNIYGLWERENPYTKTEDCEIGDYMGMECVIDQLFPDAVSQRIIEAVWKELTSCADANS